MRDHPLAWLGIGILVVAGLVILLAGTTGAIGPVGTADFARLSMLIALLIVLGGGLMFSGTLCAGTALRYGVIWLAVLLALVLAYSFYAEAGH